MKELVLLNSMSPDKFKSLLSGNGGWNAIINDTIEEIFS